MIEGSNKKDNLLDVGVSKKKNTWLTRDNLSLFRDNQWTK